MLRVTRIAGAVLGLGSCTLALAAAPATAAPKPVTGGTVVTGVQLVKGGQAAKVGITVVCTPGFPRILTEVWVYQIGSPTSGPSGTQYEATESIGSIECTGKAQRYKVVVTPTPTTQGQLSRGEASVLVGGFSEGFPDVSSHPVIIK